MISARERAAFEAGIKLGALYHQWVGTPVSPGTAGGIEAAIRDAVRLQPAVEEIAVTLDQGRMTQNTFGYSELSGMMFSVRVTTRVEGVRCLAQLHPSGDYPLMEILAIDEAAGSPHHG